MNGDLSSPSTPTSQIGVTIVPPIATVDSGGSLQFNALVTGTDQTGVTWTVSAGNISSNGMLRAPSTLSATHLTVTATCIADGARQATATVNVSPIAPMLSITTTTLAPSEIGLPYTAGLSASGWQVPYQWRILSGLLPEGVLLNAGSGILSGTATSVGTFVFVAGVVDENGTSAQQSLSTPLPLTRARGLTLW